MPLPQPKTALNNACSVIFDNTLYTYSADAFQSLRLEPGAEWEELPQGEKVTGGVCVGANTGTPSTSSFFVVGGVGGSDGYQGLQKYTYATGLWESIQLASAVTQQRVGHAAVYINSTDSILMYAGRQDGVESTSSQTHTIGASAPYTVNARDAGPAKPLYKPILLPWSAGEAVLLGGATWNTEVMLFNAAEQRWVDSGASLAEPLAKDTSGIQAVLMTGDDGSKNLITFDMTESPNAVRRTILFNGPGLPVPKAAPVRRRASIRTGRGLGDNERRAEPLTAQNWPAYNSTLAPTTTRNNFALAQGPDGKVVIAGGNDEEVLAMFDARDNSWEDADANLAQVRLLSTDSSSTSSSTTETSTTSASTSTSLTTSTSTSSAFSTTSSASVTTPAAATQTPTEAAGAAVSESSGPPVNTILGAVLGGLGGLAVLLILAFLCIKRRKKRQAHMEAGHLRRASGVSSTEKEGLGFAKDSLAYGERSPGVFRGHQHHDSQSSFSSMAILMGRAGQQKSTAPVLSGKSSNESKRDSSDSTFRAFKSTISKPMPQTTHMPVATRAPPPLQLNRGEKGVAFAANTAEPKPRNLAAGGADQDETTRRSSGWNRYWSGGSALNLLGFGNGGNNNNNAAAAATNNNRSRVTLASERSSHYSNPHRMTQDSATVPPLFPGASEPRMSLSRVTARSPTIAVYNDKLKEGLSGRIETQRPISAVSDMSASAYSSGIPESVQDAWDPTASNKPWGADRSLNDSFTGVYSTPLAPASQGLKPATQAPPRPPPPSQQQQQQQAPVRDDMSWLNLGANL